MHPYRSAPMRTAEQRRIDPEDAVLYGLMIFIGIIPVTIAAITREAFGFDATLGLMMVVAGLVGLVYHRVHARRRSLEP